MAAAKWEEDRKYHESLLDSGLDINDRDKKAHGLHGGEIETTPIFSSDVLAQVLESKLVTATNQPLLRQYGLLAKEVHSYNTDLVNTSTLPASELEQNGRNVQDHQSTEVTTNRENTDDHRIFVNMNTPWSAFICGSQGSGKSHTLSCLLENGLEHSRASVLPQPMAAMVFHYDKFTGFSGAQVCEAAYLAASADISVTVLVSPSNLHRMTEAYTHLPNFPSDAEKPKVLPLFLEERHLNAGRMMKLMAVEDDGRSALYMEVVCRILRSMAIKDQEQPGLDYKAFRRRLDLENLNPAQQTMIDIRLELLESFMWRADLDKIARKKPVFENSKKGKVAERKWESSQDGARRAAMGEPFRWSFKAGSLTIVDLSCPFVDESAACTMFDICLALFLEDRADAGRMVALDEAHKFMTWTDSSSAFTQSLLSVIRLQRHLATRVIIATQEPTISPTLLDLCSFTIVHRFSSPAWFTALRSHLAGVSSDSDDKQHPDDIFKRIADLDAGQALLFATSAMLKVHKCIGEGAVRMEKLGTRYVKIGVRKRLTADGGRSILAA